MRFLLAFCFLLFGCQLNQSSIVSLSQLENKLRESLLFANQIEGAHFNGETIERPKGVEQLLLWYKFSSSDNGEPLTHCLYYRVPYKQISGVLSLVEQKGSGGCLEVSNNSSLMKIEGIKQLKLTLENFQLKFSFTYEEKSIAWAMTMPNWQIGIEHEKYQSQKLKKLFPAMSLINLAEDSSSDASEYYIGKLADRFSLKTAHECRHINKNCQQEGEDKCDRCRYGWYQVVDYNCPQGGARFCGQNHCGEKNEPACPRGSRVVEEDDLGICQSDLTPVWSADHTLLCQ